MAHFHDEDDVTFVIETRGGDGVGPFLFGALLGAAVALLLAPRSGAETQAEIAGAVRDLRDGVQGRVTGARERVTGGVTGRIDAVRGGVESRVDRARAALEAGRGAARDARDELRRRVDDAKRSYREKLGSGGGDGATPEVVVDPEPTREDAGDLA